MTQTCLLYVNSDPGFCVFYQAMLRNYGFVVDVATSSVVAMERFNSSHFHAVIISLDPRPSAGENNGFHLVAEIKRWAPAIPVVIVSSCESVVEDAACFVDGAISSSAPVDHLLSLVQRLTGRSTFHPVYALPPGKRAVEGAGLPLPGDARELRRAAAPAIAY